ncbi:MAG TPA: hypothetical protein VGT44_10750 [Ktedonobacteraceae bacterium]|nr:hypothetical protein [Ktedonobacteraceae bacterium]
MMADYSYENSLEWTQREYPSNDHYTEFTAYIDYPMPPPPVGQLSVQPRPQRASQAQQRPQAQRQPSQDKARLKRMSKGEALDLLESLKKTILAGALIGFFVLSALVATHMVGSAANNTPSPDPSFQQVPSDNGNGFFNQQGSGSSGGGFQFGGGGGQPSSGTRVS